MSGYSAGGMFTQRYALLHPERLLAISAGQCGGYLTLPVPHYDNYRLDWPLGINDFDSLTGQSFDMDAYKNIPQFIYVGDLETDNSHSMLLWEPGFYNGWSYVNFINSTFGENDRDRLQGEINFLLANGFNNFEFVIYPNTAHEYTTQMIIDTFNFFEKNK
jgi:pimeloyl-ACP methyl ester carboxylesterase